MATTILHISDTHIHEGPKFLDGLACIDHAVMAGERSGADICIHAGDVFETNSSPAERNAFTAIALRVIRTMPMVIVRGNHDKPGDLAIYRELKGNHPVHVFERTGYVDIGDVRILALPHFDKGQLAGNLPPSYSIDEANADAADKIRAILQWFKMLAAEWSGPVVLVFHGTIEGSVLGTGQPLVGHHILSFSVAELLSIGADYVALGHIHKSQDFGNGTIHYPGSTHRKTHGDMDVKGVNVVTFQGKGEPIYVTKAETPSRAMIHIEGDWTPDGGMLGAGGFKLDQPWPSLDDISDADVRLRFRFPESVRIAAAAAAKGYEEVCDGANSVKVELLPIPSNTVRSAAVSSAKTPMAKLEALWDAGVRPDDATVARIAAKVQSLTEKLAR